MDPTKQITILKRSKSLSSLAGREEFEAKPSVLEQAKDVFEHGQRNLSESESSFANHDTESEISEKDGVDEIRVLEEKIDRLSDLFLEHSRILSELKKEFVQSKSIIEKSEVLQGQALDELLEKLSKAINVEAGESPELRFNSRARSLLDAIEAKRELCIDHFIRDALVDLLQSDALRQQMVSATAASVQAMVQESFSHDVRGVYLPLLQRLQRRLARCVSRALDDRFLELEAQTASFSQCVYNVSRELRRALERHQWQLEEARPRHTRFVHLKNTIEEVVQREVAQWRHEAVSALCLQPPSGQEDSGIGGPQSDGPGSSAWEIDEPCSPLELPDSPLQPTDPNLSAIDQLMRTAEINKQISSGDVEGAFVAALSAGDLSLVTAACRAAGQEALEASRLSQPVLLSLAQQLATDMLHETRLKTRFLEEVLINLDPCEPATRAHLPLVVGEVRRHLRDFLAKFPAHAARRRITLIVMAADHLLK